MYTYLFDFDGTLVDSMPTYVHSMLRILDENNIPYEPEIMKIITPLGIAGTAEYFMGMGLDLSKEEIEEILKNYLNLEKIIWIKDGIDPYETNGHIDDVACFVRPGEVACIYTEDTEHPFYEQAQAAYKTLCESTDAKGRKLKVHKLCLTKKPCYLEGAKYIDYVEGTLPREEGEISIASYMNFLIVNGGVILPQYGDENDALAVEQVQAMFPDRKVVGVLTKEVAFGGGNIHCITQQKPKAK